MPSAYGCPILDSGKRARQNGKRLPCEHLMEMNIELREMVRDIWNQARLLDANAHIDGIRLTEQARDEYMSRMEELGVEI